MPSISYTIPTNLTVAGTLTCSSAITSTLASTFENVKVGRGNGSNSTNIVVGIGSLTAGTGGLGGNTIIGYQSAITLTGSSSSNTFVGFQCGAVNTVSGSSNCLFGYRAGYNISSGSSNIFIGVFAGNNATICNFNVGIGIQALSAIVDGSSNVAVGRVALGSNVSGSSNVAIGAYAGYYETGSDAFYVNNQNRTNAAGDKAKSLIYGTFNSDETLQTLTVNAALTVSNSIKSNSATAGIGYGSGAGGTVVQDTSKTTGVELNKICGQITLNNEELAANTSASFTLTNSAITVTDQVMVNHIAGGTPAAYMFAMVPDAGSCAIHVRNITSAPLSEAIVLQFLVIKSVTS